MEFASLASTLGTDAGKACLLATAAVGFGLVLNQLRDHPLPLVYESKGERLEKAIERIEDQSAGVPTKAKVSFSSTATLEQLQQFLTDNAGLVLDARPEIFHRLGHIPGAISFPREDFENTYTAHKQILETDRGQPIIVYCSSSSCEDASLVQKSMNALGYSNVAVFTGGWAEWQQNNLQIEVNE